jgi:hypothetical protein
MNRLTVAGLVILAGAAVSRATDHVVPTAFAGTAGGSSFLGPLANAQRTYQLLIHEDQLTALVGSDLTGLTWRLLPSAASPWPATEVNFTNYDIYLSASVAPADRSLTFANNVAGPQTQVRSGPLTIPAASFSSGGSPNQFGTTIQFTTPWTYTGGHLLVEIRHGGFTGTSTSVDAVAATNTAAGYGTQFSACWTGNYAGTSGSQGNFSVVRLTASSGPAPCFANCDGSTIAPVLNVLDFNCFLNKFAAGDTYANCDGSTIAPVLNVLDFNCFLNKFAAGCP